MLSFNNKSLSIFDRFEIDYNLPKYKKTSGNDNSTTEVEFGANNQINVTPSFLLQPTGDISITSDTSNSNNFSLKEKLIEFLLNKLNKTKKSHKKVEPVGISVHDFFAMFTESYKELTPIGEISEYYEKTLLKAKKMGQLALVEKLSSMVDVIRTESQLIAVGLNKYVKEEQVIDFYNLVKQDKNLKLSWIKNFYRVIPNEIYEAKVSLDDRCIFDNYVILHYDPMDNGTKLTEEEKKKKEDPILFGVINGSRKLYYIGDWKDEYCDLTLDDMFSKLDKDVPEISFKTVKTYIDNGKF